MDKTKQIVSVGFRVISRNTNISILEALSKAHLFTQHIHPQFLLQTLSLQLKQGGDYIPSTLDILNLLLFNVCALNQQLICQMDDQFLESTEDQGEKNMKNKDTNGSIRVKLQKWLHGFISLPFVQKYIIQATIPAVKKVNSLRQLIETIDYLVGKYQIKTHLKTKIVQLVQGVSDCSSLSQAYQEVKKINQKIFTSGEQLARFMDLIEQNQAIWIDDIAVIVAANFEEVNPSRSIFFAADITGADLTEEIIDFLIRKISKSDLFSQRMETYRPYQLLSQIVFQKQAAAIVQWNNILQDTLNDNGSHFYGKGALFQKIAIFFTTQIPSQFPHLHQILKYTYSSLLAKYSSHDSLQLMKKFILNRLLLNPTFFALLVKPSEEKMGQYVEVANSLRILFYEKKVQVLQDQDPKTKITENSQMLINSIKSMLGSKEDANTKLKTKDQGIYINDRFLINIYNSISEGFSGFHHSSSCKSHHHSHSQVSISFSLRNQSKGIINTPKHQSQQKPLHNSSRPHVPRPNRSQTQNKSYSNRKKEEQGICDMEMLQQLIELRREYGGLQISMLAKTEERRRHRQSVERQLDILNEAMKQGKSDLIRQSRGIVQY